MRDITEFSTRNGGFRSVVVTAVEVSSALGADAESTWKGLLAGESGVRKLDDPEVESGRLPIDIGAKFKVDPTAELDRVKKRRMSYVQQVAYVMGKRIWETLGAPEVDQDRLGVSIGTGVGGAEVIVDSNDILRDQGYRKVSPFAIPMAMPNGPAAVLGLELGARASVVTPVSACSSGCESLVHAWRSIILGEADMIVAGGVEGRINALALAGFTNMRALSSRVGEPERASRPFDRDRDGFVFGESAALLVLEAEEHALARGARPIARLLGAGLTADGYHLVAPDPEGRGNARAMRRALQTAGVDGAEVDHVNAHATGTPFGDVAEAKGVSAAIGNHPSIYAPKSALGHSVGAVGALEAAISVLTLRDGAIPPTLNLDNQDAEIDLDIVSGATRYTDVQYVMNNSYGFGGHNAAVLFGKY
ncbi:3-oxoacyl-[acyl-carrier-protein] synthase II [Nocardia brasiliensis NBRC 14402]|uniref:KasA/KasB family beta-ketoacyl-ACP synthase n=1 Tax=Nocardia brasiliensis TaxID=37326 RepID=UPI0002F1AEB5|nr:KasA/KasB family beta-ketoacyl-ACP synthase [Nocardia brasiliensis]ASF10555.1 beta-ketoacyl-[acyl-carrier-protein] synthase II [Nocardia brasiliensis]GAJ80492.1 3-oxoacyl-[acyl-carrier-protein] synthase II [Nocardia brasiliensis NBRC 14402]SUB10911.1 3-oxoacyl-[acyl-carrier-protein] synthase 1 [Nocardia brasiliensis]